MKSNIRELVGEVCGRTIFNEGKTGWRGGGGGGAGFCWGKETSRMSLPLCIKPCKTVLTTGVVIVHSSHEYVTVLLAYKHRLLHNHSHYHMRTCNQTTKCSLQVL